MSLHSIPPAIVGAITFYISVFHLLIYLQRRALRLHLIFALSSFMVCLYNLCTVGLYNAEDFQSGAFWQRTQFVLICLFCIFLFRFVTLFLEHPARRTFPAVAAVYSVLAAFMLVDRSALTLSMDRLTPISVKLPSGYTITYYEANAGIVGVLIIALSVVLFLYIAWIAIRHARAGQEQQREARFLLVAIAIMFAGTFNDTAVSLRLYSFIYLLEFSFLGMMVFMAIVITRSVVEAFRVKEALAQTTALLETVLDGIPDVIGVQDGERRILRLNRSGYLFLNLDHAQVLGKSCAELPGHDAQCLFCAVADTYGTGRPAQAERYIAERRRWFDVRSYPILGREGEVSQVIQHMRDITAEKRAAELQFQFQRAQKMEAIGRLAGGIAHDFNNMLAAIKGNAELARQTVESGKVPEAEMQGIRDTVDRGAALIRQLLTFSRGQAGSPVLLRLEVLARNMEKILRPLLGGSIRLSVRIQEGLWPVKADPSQMEQILMNLIVNARDALPGKGTIEVEARNISVGAADPQAEIAPGSYVLLSVADDGCGMSEEVQAHLFEPFFTTKEGEKGTGLGLATVYGIVQQHGGRITVESGEGRGTKFRIFWPKT